MELFRALGALVETPTPGHRRLAEALGLGAPPEPAEHLALFGRELYPYASVYLGPEGMMGGEARDRIAGFWRALGATPPGECDHLSVLLSFYAGLCEAATGGVRPTGADHARRAFLWEHLMSWLPVWLGRVEELGPPFYRGWAALLRRALEEEAPAAPEPELLSAHLRQAPGLADPRRHGGREFVASLFAAVRCGALLTRSDLGRAARALDLGLRAGERAFVAQTLLSQDAAGTLRWLSQEIRRQQAAREGGSDAAPRTRSFWSARAREAADLLEELAGEAS